MDQRLSPLDASFLHIEDDVSHMHLGAVCVFEGPAPAYDDMLALIGGKLHQVPRFRQVVRSVPAELGRPVWVDYPHFNLEYHVRHSALPSPGDEEALWRLVGRIMSQQLDRHKPLWEQWIIEGLKDDQWVLISKTHHCMVDGVSGADMLVAVLDVDPDATARPPEPWAPERQPSNLRLVTDAVAGLLASPIEQVRWARAATRVPRHTATQVAQVARSTWAALGVLGRPAEPTSLNGPLGPHRRWRTTDSTVADVKAVRRALGGSFNDVVLAAITRGYRDLLVSRGESVDRTIRSLVPVSVRSRNERGTAIGDGTYDNKVSAVFTDLPLHLTDPVERLHAISDQRAGLKESKHALAAEALTGLTGFAPPILLALSGRIGSHLPQRTVNTLTTNVPGPQLPLYSVGRRMLRAYPYAPLGVQLRVGVAIFSYDGQVTFGVTADFDSTPDIAVLTDGIAAGMRELLAAASRAAPTTTAPALDGSPLRSWARRREPDAGLHPARSPS